MAAGIVLAQAGLWILLRTVVPNQDNGNLVDLLLKRL
jgi:hypothetical protein